MSVHVVVTHVAIKNSGGLVDYANGVWRAIQLRGGGLVATGLIAYMKVSGVSEIH